MPSSSAYGKLYTSLILEKLHSVGELVSIVDVGCGQGQYHDLMAPSLPGVRWVGVEVWEPYVERFCLRRKYDQLVVADVRAFDFSAVAPVSAVLFGDILEHMTKEEAIATVERARAVAPYVLLSIPVVHFPQGEIEGNPYEVHVKDDWSHYEVMLSFTGVAGFFIHDHIGVYLLAGTGRALDNVAALQGLIPPLVRQKLPNDRIAWGGWSVVSHL